jgi:metacaspase-1
MKKITLFIFFITWTIALLGQTKHALIIAVSEYQEGSGWKNINSKNDVPILESALINRGFEKANIHSFIDAPIDAQDILDLMRKLLIEKTKPGDIVFFHFSGHGQQIADNDGDEVDGLDETLVPYNAPMKNVYSNARGEVIEYNYTKHLRDDDLGKVLYDIRKHIGPEGNVFVTIDACHSGTSTRGMGSPRGTDEINVPKGWRAPEVENTRGATSANQNSLGLFVTNNEKLANMVCFYGSTQYQLNYEYSPDKENYYGSLSYAMSEAISNIESGASYRALFDRLALIMSKIAPRQTPVAEGNLDQEIFGGTL